jgi:hypothetical protein
MKKTFLSPIFVLLITSLLLAVFPTAVRAQDENPEYRLNVKRNFGFSSGSQIKGNFTSSIIGPAENVQSVTYLIDAQEMETISEAPFQYTFRTEDYEPDWHELSARVLTRDGRTIVTATRRFQFVTSEEEFAAVRNIIFPLLGGIFGLMLLMMGLQMTLLRDKTSKLAPGTARNYGFRGGTICSRCDRPFAIHLWALNFGPWKFDRCDFCGKWAFVSRLNPDILRDAEQAELAAAKNDVPQISTPDEDEEMRKRLDDSRYIE